jgi:hypothetical protein
MLMRVRDELTRGFGKAIRGISCPVVLKVDEVRSSEPV